MRTRSYWAVAVSVAMAVLLPAPAIADALCTGPSYLDGYACRQLVLKYDESVFDPAAIEARYELTLIGLIPVIDLVWYQIPGSADLLAVAESLRGEQGVVRVELNGEFIPPECRQWSADILELGPGAAPAFRVQASRGVLSPPAGNLGAGIVVAVLDTGVAHDHPLFADLLLPGIDLIDPAQVPAADDRGNNIDEDGENGPDTGWGHGTSVAGLVHLMAPHARILPVRVLDDECTGTAFSLAEGIVRAVGAGADVINMSFGALEGPELIMDALEYAQDRGVIVVGSAGNDGNDSVEFPAREARTIGVAAVDIFRVAWQYTNYHDRKVELAAPGVDVIIPYRGSYYRSSGTSLSAAIVSGAVAVQRWARPDLTEVTRIHDHLAQTAQSVDPYNPMLIGELGAGVPDLTAIRASAVETIFRRAVGSLAGGWRAATLPLDVSNDDVEDGFPKAAGVPSSTDDDSRPAGELILYRALIAGEGGGVLRLAKKEGGAVEIFLD